MSYWDNLINAIRNVDGSYFYYKNIGHQSATLDGYSNYKACLHNPVLFGLIDKIGMYLGQTDFYIGDPEDKKSDPLINLINDPNEYQSKQDFFKEYVFQRIANGYTFIAPIGSEGFENRVERVDSLFNLSGRYVQYDTSRFQTKLLTREEAQEKAYKFRYNDGHGTKRDFKLSQVIPFFDVANGLNDDFLLNSPSKIDSVLQPAVNMIKAFEAQNIIIKSNGREMFFSEQKGDKLNIQRPISNDDKNEIQRKNNTYGMQRGQSRSMFLRGETGWKSLHIDAKDLALQETVETTASAIASAFNVPKDLIPVFDNAKYENKKESEIQLIQSVVKPIADDICNSFSSFFKGYENNPLQCSFDHLAPMQHIEEIKTTKAMQLSIAFRNLTQSGMSAEQAQSFFEDLGIKTVNDESN